jgi:hypothetical protein
LSPGRRHIPPQLENVPAYEEDPLAFYSENKADTPISSYVRRKTPQTSPISPAFPRYFFHEEKDENLSIPSPSMMPFLLPTLPSIHPKDITPFSTPFSDAGSDRESSTGNSPSLPSESLPETMEVEPPHPRSHHTGLRLSAPHRLDIEHHQSRHVSPV